MSVKQFGYERSTRFAGLLTLVFKVRADSLRVDGKGEVDIRAERKGQEKRVCDESEQWRRLNERWKRDRVVTAVG